MMARCKQGRSVFTLMELLVVIAIIAILAALTDDAHGCAVMDIRMPGMNRHAIQGQLHDRNSHIRVNALSPQDGEEACERLPELGAASFFRKPVDDHAQLDAIRWALWAQE